VLSLETADLPEIEVPAFGQLDLAVLQQEYGQARAEIVLLKSHNAALVRCCEQLQARVRALGAGPNGQED
jgi:hypothetical protein